MSKTERNVKDMVEIGPDHEVNPFIKVYHPIAWLLTHQTVSLSA
jgi:hypothetical protein